MSELEKSGYLYLWKYHIRLVLKHALRLSKKYKCNKEVVILSSLLHDIGISKYGRENHEITSADEAEKILKNFGYSEEIINHVKKCIIEHRDKINLRASSIESEILRNADVLSVFSAIPYLLFLAHYKFQKNLEEAWSWAFSKLEEDLNSQMLPEVRKEVERKYKNFLRLFKEIRE
ncbi:MAG: HD domain-containing protein [Candidatus Aenigmatarchaeota archaeon]